MPFMNLTVNVTELYVGATKGTDVVQGSVGIANMQPGQKVQINAWARDISPPNMNDPTKADTEMVLEAGNAIRVGGALVVAYVISDKTDAVALIEVF